MSEFTLSPASSVPSSLDVSRETCTCDSASEWLCDPCANYQERASRRVFALIEEGYARLDDDAPSAALMVDLDLDGLQTFERTVHYRDGLRVTWTARPSRLGDYYELTAEVHSTEHALYGTFVTIECDA